MPSAMMTILIGTTRNQAASHVALDRLIPVLRELVDDIARPAGTPKQ